MASQEPPEKSNDAPSETPAPAPGDSSVPAYWHEQAVPRTVEQRAELLALRPEGWGEVLYASYLLAGKERLAPQRYDHRLELVTPRGSELSPKQAGARLDRALNEITTSGPRLIAVYNTATLKKAWGETAEAADPELIEHLATRFIEVYRDMLKWAADLRSARVPEPLRPAFRTASHFLDKPLEQISEHVDRFVAEMDNAQKLLESGKRVDMYLDLDFYDDEQLAATFQRQLNEAGAALASAPAARGDDSAPKPHPAAQLGAGFVAGYYGTKAVGAFLKDVFKFTRHFKNWKLLALLSFEWVDRLFEAFRRFV